MADDQSVEEVKEEIDPLTLFPEGVQKPVEGLMYLGHLTETISFCGHTFGLRTLQPQHKFAISLVLQPYRNTIHEVDVFQALHVGMALTHVDGDQDFCPPIGPDIAELGRARLTYIATNWYPPTVEYLWSRFAFLEAAAAKAVDELDRLSQRSQPTTLPPWLDSLIEQGPSTEKTSSDTPLSTPSS